MKQRWAVGTWKLWVRNMREFTCTFLHDVTVKTKRDRRVPFVAWGNFRIFDNFSQLKRKWEGKHQQKKDWLCNRRLEKSGKNVLTYGHFHFHIKLVKLSWKQCFLVFCMKCQSLFYVTYLLFMQYTLKIDADIYGKASSVLRLLCKKTEEKRCRTWCKIWPHLFNQASNATSFKDKVLGLKMVLRLWRRRWNKLSKMSLLGVLAYLTMSH